MIAWFWSLNGLAQCALVLEAAGLVVFGVCAFMATDAHKEPL